MVDKGSHGFNGLQGYIQGCLHIDMPFRRTQLTEHSYLTTSEQRFTTTKSHPSASSLEIQIINHHLVLDFLHAHLFPYAVSLQALHIQTIFAAERTVVKSHERCHALSVTNQSVTTDTYQGNRIHFRLKNTGRVKFTLTAVPICLPGIHLGINEATRTASSSSNG